VRATIQRVSRASVTVEGELISKIEQGMLLLLGIENEDTSHDIEWLARKVAHLRIFDDSEGVMNHSLIDINGDAIVVSQFTLHASTKKGKRPSYLKAAKPEIAIPIYEQFVLQLDKELGKKIATGVFGAYMQVDLVNDGPVTINIDTKNRE